MSFFIPDRKRKRTHDDHNKPKRTKKSETQTHHAEQDIDDEDILSSDEEGGVALTSDKAKKAEGKDFEETVDEKKLRVARQVLNRMKKTTTDSGEEPDDEAIHQKLKEEAWAARHGGRLGFRRVADKLVAANIDPNNLDITRYRGHKLPITCALITDDEKFVFSASKDCTIVKWDIAAGKKVFTIKGGRNRPELGGHTDQVLALAITSDGKYLASGGMDKDIRIWDAQTCTLVDTFKGHKDTVTCLTFRVGTYDLYSSGFDRQVKVWDCKEMMYVDTLFGHQQEVYGIDALTRETCVTSGADKNCRVWKIVNRTCLVFKGPKCSLECISLINEDRFLTGAQDGSIQLWNAGKKKPEVVVHKAHTLPAAETPMDDGDDSAPNPFKTQEQLPWVTAITALKYGDLFATGSSTGQIKVWRTHDGWRGVSTVLEIPVEGFVNSLQFSPSGSYLIAGIGQEHRLGRWTRLANAKNGVCIIRLPLGK